MILSRIATFLIVDDLIIHSTGEPMNRPWFLGQTIQSIDATGWYEWVMMDNLGAVNQRTRTLPEMATYSNDFIDASGQL